eukprot:116444-Hanusia_phi.AAC.1
MPRPQRRIRPPLPLSLLSPRPLHLAPGELPLPGRGAVAWLEPESERGRGRGRVSQGRTAAHTRRER